MTRTETSARDLALAYLRDTGLSATSAAEAAHLETSVPVFDNERLGAEDRAKLETLRERIALLESYGVVTLGHTPPPETDELSAEEKRAVRDSLQHQRCSDIIDISLALALSTEPVIAELRTRHDELVARSALPTKERASRLKELLQRGDGAPLPSPKTWLREHASGGEAILVRFELERLAREELQRQIEEAKREGRRGAAVIRFGTAGYNATTRTRRMVEDLIRKRGIDLPAKVASQLKSWNPNSLPLDARIVFLGCLAALTDKNLMPDLSPKGRPELGYVLIPLPGGISELADYCGYEREGEAGIAGEKHGRAVRRQVKKGLDRLVEEARDLFHIWDEWDPKEKCERTQYAYVREPVGKLLSEGFVEQQVGGQSEMFLSPYAQYIGISRMALLGAFTNYQEIPGDLLSRYRRALDTLAGQAKADQDLNRLVGTHPRMTDTDLEFLLWCFMHSGRRAVKISDVRLMDRIGLGKLIEQRKMAQAQERLLRALEVAKLVGALHSVEEVDATDNASITRLYVFGQREVGVVEEPQGLPGGTLPLELE